MPLFRRCFQRTSAGNTRWVLTNLAFTARDATPQKLPRTVYSKRVLAAARTKPLQRASTVVVASSRLDLVSLPHDPLCNGRHIFFALVAGGACQLELELKRGVAPNCFRHCPRFATRVCIPHTLSKALRELYLPPPPPTHTHTHTHTHQTFAALNCDHKKCFSRRDRRRSVYW